MSIPQPLKAAFWPLLATALVAVAVLFQDVIVARIITPKVLGDLRQQGHVRPEIGEGRFGRPAALVTRYANPKLAAEIVEDLEAALEQFREIAEDLGISPEGIA